MEIYTMNKYLLLLCCLVTACTTTRPKYTDPGLYTIPQEWATSLHDGWFSARTYSLGKYSTGSRQGGIAKAGLPLAIQHPTDAYFYTVSGPSGSLAVQTLNTVRVVFGDRPLPAYLSSVAGTTPVFYALVNDPVQSMARWELLLRNASYLELNQDAPIGVLQLDKVSYRVTAHNHFGTINSYEKVTYEIQDHGKPLAAVMPGAVPRVWVSSTVTPQQEALFAAVISTLLLR
ncbi:hypothetical protein DCC81_03090 [Chitinophaga parva]|uniref:Uncharacterized protein n=2 Tax=Chitinophaga parva TaxID=2169414 RepID=A0A2T7BLC3_9BACT|nr:hypothetical protein DCC81_03090 [Chitinophaga parva]